MSKNMYGSGLGLMEPVARIGDNVAIHYLDTVSLRRVRFQEAIPPFQALDAGALAANTTTARTNVPNLSMADSEFGQFRWYPLDNIQVRLFLPQSQGKYILRNVQTALDPQVVNRDPCLHLTEFYVWEDNRPFVEILNYADYALTQTRIVAMGFRFNVEKIDTDLEKKILGGLEPVVHVWCSGRQM